MNEEVANIVRAVAVEVRRVEITASTLSFVIGRNQQEQIANIYSVVVGVALEFSRRTARDPPTGSRPADYPLSPTDTKKHRSPAKYENSEMNFSAGGVSPCRASHATNYPMYTPPPSPKLRA